MKWCVEYTEFCLVIKFKHMIPSVCVQKIFLLALWSQKIQYFMQPWEQSCVVTMPIMMKDEKKYSECIDILDQLETWTSAAGLCDSSNKPPTSVNIPDLINLVPIYHQFLPKMIHCLESGFSVLVIHLHVSCLLVSKTLELAATIHERGLTMFTRFILSTAHKQNKAF
jgi:hypothetical protein